MSKHNLLNRRGVLSAVASLLSLLSISQVFPQNTVKRSLRLIVGSPPGALGDVVTRLVSSKLNNYMDAAVLVDNKAGASGIISAELVAKASPDGSTLLVAADNVFVVNSLLYQKLSYDLTDFRSVALLGRGGLVLIARPSLGINNLNDFINYAKLHPARVTFSSGGAGHVTHIGTELIANRMGIKLLHVPYKGTTPALTAVISSEVDVMLVGLAGAMPFIKSGRAIALAITGSASKELLPNLPYLKDIHPDLDVTYWFGVFAPKETSSEVVANLNATVNKILKEAEVEKKFASMGMWVSSSKPADLEALIKEDKLRYGPLVSSLNIKPE